MINKNSIKKELIFRSNFCSSLLINYLLKYGFNIKSSEDFEFNYKNLENCVNCRYWNRISRDYQNGYCNKLRNNLDFNLKFPKEFFKILIIKGFRVKTKQNFSCSYFDFKRKINE